LKVAPGSAAPGKILGVGAITPSTDATHRPSWKEWPRFKGGGERRIMQQVKKIFGNDPEHLNNTLSHMVQQRYIDCNCSQTEMYKQIRLDLDNDNRFNGMNKDYLVKQLEEKARARVSGIDFNDPSIWRR
jgi:hypothetical protein